MRYELGYGHYMLAADRRLEGTRTYDLYSLLRTSLGDERQISPPPTYDLYSLLRTPQISPPPTPLWHWAVW